MLITVSLFAAERYVTYDTGTGKQKVTHEFQAITAVSGIYSIDVADNPTVEFTIYEDNSTIPRTVGEFLVDLQKASTGFDAVHTPGDTITIRVYVKIDGVNYRQLDNSPFVDNSITNHPLVKNFMTNRPVKFTGQTSADRGAFDLPYSFTYRNEQ